MTYENLYLKTRNELTQALAELTVLRKRVLNLETRLSEQERRAHHVETRLRVHPKSGLPNHHSMDGALTALFEQSLITKERIAVVIARMDNKYDLVLKSLRDTITEWVIYQMGQRLRESLGERDLLFHSRDEEFIIILRSIRTSASIKKRVAKIAEAIRRPHLFSGYHVSVGCHVGLAIYPLHGDSKQTMLQAADLALSEAVRLGKQVQIFRDEMRRDVIEKIELQTHILRALEAQAFQELDKHFTLYIQPIISLGEDLNADSPVTGLHGEVLIRWHHPDRGLVAPDQFIPVAEETGLIQPIGNWVLFRTADLLDRWASGPLRNVKLAVNISPRQFINDQLMENVITIVNRKTAFRKRLKLEITETSFMNDPVNASRKMSLLADQGVEFAVDDFGKEYASFSYLQQLPVSTIKIDQQFIRDVHTNKQSLAIVKAILAMGRDLEHDIVCEGVESGEHVRVLHSLGARKMQGYYFSRPVPWIDFEAAHDRWMQGQFPGA